MILLVLASPLPLPGGTGDLSRGTGNLPGGAGDLSGRTGDLSHRTGDLPDGTGNLPDGTGNLSSGRRKLENQGFRPFCLILWSAPAKRSGDGAFWGSPHRSGASQSGVALRFPPHSRN